MYVYKRRTKSKGEKKTKDSKKEKVRGEEESEKGIDETFWERGMKKKKKKKRV